MGRKNIQGPGQVGEVERAEAVLRRLLPAIRRVAATPGRFTPRERLAIVNVVMAAVESENDKLAIQAVATMVALDAADVEALIQAARAEPQ